ncbi:Beta-glucoside kinase [Anaerococcus octavius]|uniref:Beta-glucoside kinase n=1 Tax=Anaerococcus octavius TaxID=54007 RepID=A0A380WXD9_9FIRM|nr:ROK family protein [Anaerococcus octavius]SUU93443.1 Beta-glucoside kinase [Anaerococcus octavius]
MYLVFDIGGSSNKYALIENDKIVEKFSSKQEKNMEDLLKFFEDKINFFAKSHKIDGIGFSSPGTVDSSTGNIYGKSAVEFITEYNFALEIKNKFNLPVAIENDANCAALAEIFYGKVDKNYLAFLIIGSGIGGSITKNGKIIKGKSLEAGEFGYMLLKNEDGNFDNFSKLATLPNIRRKMIKKYGIDESTYLIFDKYMQKKEPYFTEVDQMFTYLAMGIYNIFYTVNPEKIYLGGAISSDERFVREIKNKLNTGVFRSIDIDISSVSFFNDNNLYGAYANLKQSIEEKRLLK